jgi:ferredoxin
MLKVRIKEDACVGHGMCRMACPQVFQLNDEDGHAYVLSEDVPEAHVAAVQMAIRSCPEQAIETI